ncbi:CCN family member 2 [Herpailurus yagouaroundi]|uniref:CCN family member 2 n=1 Tax=Herpailurus yagouaroundi TaxID=1608482 RepID=UPI001AD662E4|nr:CCN family member 2 [Puma yagouaroundi]
MDRVCQLFQTGGMLSVKGSGSIRCELMRQEGGEECEECPCLCRTPFSSLASRGRPERIKAAGRPPQPHTTTLPTERRQPVQLQPRRPTASLRRQPPRPTAPRPQPGAPRHPPPARARDPAPGPPRPPRRRRRTPLTAPSSPQPAAGQDCGGPCQCATAPAPRCPAGVSLVLDGCGCCRVCAKQLGELCTERDPCDPHKGLFCDFGSPANRKIGVCTAKDGAPCVFGGTVYRSGESFQSSCKYQCTCLDGAVGCVPLCSMDVRLPSPDCPFPRRVKLPGKCCEEWVCDEPKDHTVVGPALAAYRLEDTFGPDPTMIRANCLVQTTEWSACSKTCGMGISTRVTNDNAFCRLEKQSRLCMVRPCEADLEENIKKGKKCIRTPKISKPVKFELSGCTSVKTYRAKFCGVCTDGRCCTPHRTTTLPVEFKCPDGELMKKSMMFIKTCACHYNCPGDNDIFESLYYRKMYGDMA